ncbi:MAG: hypothetical protein AcusKO_45790 [Acuticoccus sp.]
MATANDDTFTHQDIGDGLDDPVVSTLDTEAGENADGASASSTDDAANESDEADNGTVTVVGNSPPVAQDFSTTVPSYALLPGDTVGQLVASDADADDLIFSLLAPPDTDNDGTPAFTLSADGVLTVSDADEYDINDVSILSASFTVSDGVDTDTGLIAITIGPANHVPTVENSRFSVVENDPAGLVLGKIVASDPDGDALTLEIIENFDFDGDTLPAFGIDASGMLYIVDSDDIDFETRPYLELAVMATDPYGASDVGFVSVDVFDWPEAPTYRRCRLLHCRERRRRVW